jgi:polyisoprenoid-binding protein YceI
MPLTRGGAARKRLSAVGAVLSAAIAFGSVAEAASAWTADPARSRLEFTATQAGGEFDGRFERFRPEIVFDPADLASSRIVVEIETGSADTQDKDRDTALAGEEFFAVARWPSARYEARQFTAAGGDRFEAHGKLTLRGITRDVRLAFSFKPSADGRTAALSGGTTIRRLDFGIGQGEWADPKWIGNEVRIRFVLALQQ